MKRTVHVAWRRGPVEGTIEVDHGALADLRVLEGRGVTRGNTFSIPSANAARLAIVCSQVRIGPGGRATRVTVRTRKHPFTFFLRDVTPRFPIWIPTYDVAVTVGSDTRDYEAVVRAITGQGFVSIQAAIENAAEESYENACRRNRNQNCPTWLGLGRDMRIFRIHDRMPNLNYGCFGVVEPCYNAVPAKIEETNNRPYRLHFHVGPGSSCRIDIRRRLDEGCLPILRAEQREDDVLYDITAFATLETHPLASARVRGTDWRAAYANSAGQMLKPDERVQIKDLLDHEMHHREEEVICCIRVTAVNQGTVPRYAWFKGLRMTDTQHHAFDGRLGASRVGSDRVYAIHRLNGRPMPDEEMALLLQPGQSATLDMLVPHQPLSAARARRLAKLNVDEHLDACRRYWRRKLAGAGRIHVPEPAIDERIRAGLLHCDLVTLGREPRDPLLTMVGWYSPIGSESSPIIQFFDSMGWHRVAERALDFFLERQRPDGLIQNFNGYQLETGPVLWTLGEHYRYTRDDAWVRRIQPRVLKACEYLLAWRTRNKRPELRGKGYGLLDGKVADPEDYFRSFMLNGLSYLGLRRAAEMLHQVAPSESRRLHRECNAFLRDIRTAFYESLARSPVIPLGDGTWVPSAPPWPEYPGPVSLYAEGGEWHTHGAFGARDSLIGALYLVVGEVLGPHEVGTESLLKMHQQLFTVENAALSQPYYCRHDYVHLIRDEVKPFLKTYYNQLTALQDRETYTFWEHYFHVGQHKTHEEAWFLMQTRWMLWFEEGETLRLLRAVPRRWLADGQTIRLDGVASYFGPLSLEVESRVARNRVTARMVCETNRKPRRVALRIPHPDGRQARAVEGGRYDASRETVWISPFKGEARVTVFF